MRPDLEDQIIEQGKKEGRMWQQKRTVSWVINSLRKGDVYVADTYNKEFLGTAIGSNLGNGVYNATGNGMITYGHIRDMERLRKIEGFNVWCKGYDPSYMRQTILTNYNVPVRIGKAIVIPGDAVLAKPGAVLFIPCHLVVPKETIDKIRDIHKKAEATIFKGDDLCINSILSDSSIDFGEYALGRKLKRKLILKELANGLL
jgi:regulator of RNase E activity RraA